MEDNRERAAEILRILGRAHSNAPVTYLDHRNPFEMLIATILSASTTDASVNKVTPTLFKKYPTPAKLASADLNDLRDIIHSVGTYNNKSIFIQKASEMLVDEFNSKIPRTIRELVKLKGVSRKTANVVLQVAFKINEGIVVDTHIRRVSQRLRLTEQNDPKKIEADLMEIIPEKDWGEYARLVGAQGRRICIARKPKCSDCPINHLCPSAEL